MTYDPKTDSKGAYIKYFDSGDEVRVIAENDQTETPGLVMDAHGISPNWTGTLMTFDAGDNTWQIRFRNPYTGTSHRWVAQDLIEAAGPVDDEELEDAIASIKMGMHPDLLKLLAYEEEAVAQGYKDGDVNHFIQPIIGLLRMKLANNELPDKEFLEYSIDRMLKACKAETAWLKRREWER